MITPTNIILRNFSNERQQNMILLHINDKTKRQQIVSLCHSLNHQIKLFDEADAEHTVGELAGISKPGHGKSGENADKTQLSDKLDSSNKSMPDCIIFSDISSDAMDRFLAEYKKRGIEPTHLKAIVTVHNMKWSVDELINELKKEQIAIMMRGRRQ